ncbi:hypothetical protein AM1BK_34810 [Neobacillus kokaensis]|uniref:Uncharacterized protein n=1 Tax=Neobacillus kokaensis TaxID=2759023 RepID=A0ABQ3N4S7_9BACI|nr:hypothetical protein AM1BK_34810 [Neobacillus kokaensis]
MSVMITNITLAGYLRKFLGSHRFYINHNYKYNFNTVKQGMIMKYLVLQFFVLNGIKHSFIKKCMEENLKS